VRLHAVAEGLALILREVDTAAVEWAAVAIVRGVSLRVSTDGCLLHAVHVHGRAAVQALAVHAVLAVHVAHPTLMHRREVPIRAQAVRAHVQCGRSTHVVVVAAVATVLVEMLALQLVLDALAVRGVTNERKHWPDAIDKSSALLRVGIVESSLQALLSGARM
jgi:hypothetical protein